VAARLTGDGSGSNIPSGRVLGPVEQKAAPQSLLDTLKIRHKRRSRLTAQEVLGCLVRVLALLLGGLLCGAGAFLISYSPFLPKTKVLLFTFAAVLSFCIGALFGGWILRPFRSK
jgi:hypothetical protein